MSMWKTLGAEQWEKLYRGGAMSWTHIEEGLTKDDLALEMTCPECRWNPRNRWTHTEERFDCKQCKGTGKVPTGLGQQILEFIKRYAD